jgi:glycosyltransferase involved in cell wall biosynthesis
MRVLHIVSGKLYGGVETVLVTLARCRAFCPAMVPEFALCFGGRLKDELIASGVSVYDLGEVRVRYPHQVWRARRRLRELIGAQRPDLVVCHMAWANAIFGPAVRLADRPLVFWLHGATNGKHWLERWARATPPDLALAPSFFVAATLKSLYPELTAEVLYYPVERREAAIENGDRATIRSEFATSPDATVVIQASRMEPWKGQSQHLKALATLREVPGWICWQVGGAQRSREREYLAALKETAVRLGIEDRVRFLGQRPDVPRLLHAADIYCQPNTGLEGLPVVFSEALYAGLPVVTSDIGGFSEVIDDRCGRLVPVGDVLAVAAALRELITDSALRRRLGGAGPAHASAMCEPGAQLRRLHHLLTYLERPRLRGASAAG